MWNSIIGHLQQIEQLRKALSSGMLPNAWLFAGPRGVGKRLVADVLGCAIACSKSRENEWDPCGGCIACRKVLSGNHPDVFIVRPESQIPGWEELEGNEKKKPSDEIKIDQIRELQGRVRFHPMEAPAKLVVIDEADRMTESCANSLLKILEEPPALTTFVLISANPFSLLPTIRSRCRRIAFQPLALAGVIHSLTHGGRMSDKEAQRIAKLSGGSLGLALSIEPDFVEGVLGRFMALSKGGSSSDIIGTAESWSHEDISKASLIFDILVSWHRDHLRQGTEGMSVSRMEGALSELESARRTLDTTANKQLMFEKVLFSLTRFSHKLS